MPTSWHLSKCNLVTASALVSALASRLVTVCLSQPSQWAQPFTMWRCTQAKEASWHAQQALLPALSAKVSQPSFSSHIRLLTMNQPVIAAYSQEMLSMSSACCTSCEAHTLTHIALAASCMLEGTAACLVSQGALAVLSRLSACCSVVRPHAHSIG